MIFRRVIEALYWEILYSAVELLVTLALYFTIFEVPDKVVMSLSESVEKIYEKFRVRDETATNEWVWKVFQRQRKIVDLKGRVDVELLVPNLSFCP